jgi:hypothetical protein
MQFRNYSLGAGALLGGMQILLPEPVHAADTVQQVVASIPKPVSTFELAQDTPIWENLVRYAQYFFSVMLGTAYVMLKPIAQLLKNPVTGILTIIGVVGLFYFIKVTVNAMLGVEDLFEYNPISAVTPVK